MKFGEKIRELRKSKNLTRKELGDLVGVGFAYPSKVENERLDFGDYPSEDLIRKLATALKTDEDELMLLAKKSLSTFANASSNGQMPSRSLQILRTRTLIGCWKRWKRREGWNERDQGLQPNKLPVLDGFKVIRVHQCPQTASIKLEQCRRVPANRSTTACCRLLQFRYSSARHKN